jgi:predicted O-linked N-acetylglucosamine transferase (SPINDLY family)
MNRYLDEARRLLGAGDFEAAAGACRKSLRMGKDAGVARTLLADCHYNLGVTHLRRGAHEEALEQFRLAFEVDSTHADAANNLGSSLLVRGERERAIECFRAAVRLKPRERRYLVNLVRNLVLVGELEEASTLLLRLATVNPANAGAYLLAEALLVPETVPDAAYPERIRAELRAKLARLEREEHAIEDPLELSASYFPLSYHGLSNVDIARSIARLYLRWCPWLGWTSPHAQGWKRPSGRIRIGFASRFFRNHSISNTSRGLIERFDRKRFEVVAVRLVPSANDAAAQAIDAAADRVATIALDPAKPRGDLAAAREAIARLELDVLFYQDIGLEPLSYFLALARLAPVQLTSFGHPDTTGIPNLDCFVSSALYETPGAERDYSERLVQLPDAGTLAYYYRPPVPAAPAPRTELALEEGDRIYFCAQTLQKIQPAMDAIFARIAELDPHARIVLIEFEAHKRRALEARFARHSPLLAQRVRFVDMVPYERFLARLAAADVLLDTVHFNGQNTTLEAFAVGTPVVTLPGALQRARHGQGLYRAMGFTELVASDAEDYARKAVRVATDAAFRTHCRERIAATSAAVFEDPRVVTSFEDAIEAMVARVG